MTSSSYTSTSYDNEQERSRVISFLRNNVSRHDLSILEVDEYGYVNILNTQNFVVPQRCVVDGKLAFRFGAVRTIDFSRLGLTSLYGIPYLAQLINLSHNSISSLEDLGKTQCKTLNLTGNPITSLPGIDKKLFGCEGILLDIDSLESHLLGAMFIKGFKGYYSEVKDFTKQQKSLPSFRAVLTINKCITEKMTILKCQQMLMSANLSEFVKL
jgi:hypothetical protein